MERCDVNYFRKIPSKKWALILSPLRSKTDTARSREDETRNARQNANRNPEWWGDFSQLVKNEKLKFLGVSRYKFELRFWLNLNFCISRYKFKSRFGFHLNVQLTKISPPFRISICIPTSILSLIFHGTGCTPLKEMIIPREMILILNALQEIILHTNFTMI